jgi:O-antigen ligase
MIITAAFGDRVPFLPGRLVSSGTAGYQDFEATRIIVPGITLIFIMFIMMICMVGLIHKPFFKSRNIYLLFLIGSAVILTYRRNEWVTIIICFFIFVFLASKKVKRRILAVFVIAIVLAALLIPPLLIRGGRPRSYVESVFVRFSSLFFAEETFSSNSLEWRKVENEYAQRSIVQNPFLGIGLGVNYRPQIPWMDTQPEWDSPSYIHNGYLWILIDMGILGFVPFMWFYIRFLVRGFSKWRKIRDPLEKSAVIGFTLSGIAISLSAMAEPAFMEWHSIVVIATVMGLTEAIIKRNEKESPEIGR